MKTKERTENHWDEPSDRERRIKAGYRRLLRAGLDGKGGQSKVQRLKSKVQRPPSAECGVGSAEFQTPFSVLCFVGALGCPWPPRVA